MTFFRVHADQTRELAPLDNLYGSIQGSDCWLVGGGPSLRDLPLDRIQQSPAPIMCMNFAGRGKDGEELLLRPDLWTAFDPCARFHRSIFANPGIQKLMKWSHRMDLVPDSTEKMCDCPNTWFFETEYRGYKDFLNPSAKKILDSRDTMLQAVDVLYRLGFRRIFLVGCELIIRPSDAQIALAREHGVTYENGLTILAPEQEGAKPRPTDRLDLFLKDCIDKGVGADRKETVAKLIAVDREEQYSFSEEKQFQASAATDGHYYANVQRLRLGRRSMALAGLQLVSCTPGSRLNDYFPFMDADEACALIEQKVGMVANESTIGRYREEFVPPGELYPLMEDINPHRWERILQKKMMENNDIDIPQKKPDRMGEIKKNFDKIRLHGNVDDHTVNEVF